MKNLTFVVDTQDTRMFYLLRHIRDRGYEAFSRESFTDTSPVFYCFSPSKRFNEDELLSLNNNSILICGRIAEEQNYILEQKKITHKNILNDEIFAIENAVQTAEATLMLMIRATNLSMYDMKISILGYGRVGKSVAELYKSIGLDFDIYTDDYYERANARLCKCGVYPLAKAPGNVDVIINTIPAKILTINKLQRVKKSCYILDLSSYASCDNSDISALGLLYDNALGLPGKYSPKSAGRILAEAILRLDEVKLCL